MTNVVLWERSPEEQAAFDQFTFEEEVKEYEKHVERSKHRGDYHALAAQAISGEGDYSEADHGMHWSDIRS